MCSHKWRILITWVYGQPSGLFLLGPGSWKLGWKIEKLVVSDQGSLLFKADYCRAEKLRELEFQTFTSWGLSNYFHSHMFWEILLTFCFIIVVIIWQEGDYAEAVKTFSRDDSAPASWPPGQTWEKLILPVRRFKTRNLNCPIQDKRTNPIDLEDQA